MLKTEASSSFQQFRDWAHLLPEIVELISSKVKSTTDYVRFRAVCSPWRSGSHPKPRHHLPPQLPWLMIPYSRWDPTCVYFDDIWESKRRKFHLPEAKGMAYCASYCGWLLLVEHNGMEVFLLNPLTRARVGLPPFAAPFKSLGGDSFDQIVYAYDGRSPSIKVTFSADLTDPDCQITVFLASFWVICCRVGDPYWTWVNCRTNIVEMMDDGTYYNGRFYLLYEECVVIIESDKPEVTRTISMPELTELGPVMFLEGKCGVYVLAVNPQENFVLYQFLEESLILKQIADTSNNTAIFYGYNYPCLTVCADDWDSLDGGSVLMEKKCVPNASKYVVGLHYSIYSSKWDGQKIEHMVRDLGNEPQYRPGEPVMWFQPSFV
ncbi:F-box family protein [Rhynchospora pubera]|uniref:F-box family protein n=1 Tax=Rhynchospora pubera TaxID=906938 RepID=A0AAV8EEB6_9POAL|nr:F-box family protein [Rhynchospora pubera]